MVRSDHTRIKNASIVFNFLGSVVGQNAKTYHVITNSSVNISLLLRRILIATEKYFQVAWHKALDYCHTLGYKLASITTKEENDQLEKQLIEAGECKAISQISL